MKNRPIALAFARPRPRDHSLPAYGLALLALALCLALASCGASESSIAASTANAQSAPDISLAPAATTRYRIDRSGSTLPRRARRPLEVLLFAQDGSPWPRPVTTDLTALGDAMFDWPDEVAVLLYEHEQQGHHSWPGRWPTMPDGRGAGAQLDWGALSPAVVEYALRPDRTYTLAVYGAGFTPSFRRIDAGDSLDALRFEFRSEREPDLARLELRLHARGERWMPRGSWDGPELLLEDPASGVVLCWRPEAGAPGIEWRAPTGDWRVSAVGRSFDSGGYCGPDHRTRVFGRTVAEWRAETAKSTRLDFELAPPGRLSIRLAGEPEPADRQAARRGDHLGRDPAPGHVERAASVARISLHSEGARPEFVLRTEAAVGEGQFYGFIADRWPLGVDEQSEPVSAGTHELVAMLPGGRVLSREVVVRGGETTRVELEF